MGSRLGSIAARLLLASALLLPLFLGLTGFFLDRAFENSLEVAERSRLRGHVNLLMSVAEPETRNDRITGLRVTSVTLSEADFEHPNSGLYGYIFNGDAKAVWHSNSAALNTPPDYKSLAKSDTPGKMLFSEKALENKPHFMNDPYIMVARKLLPWQYEKGWADYSHRHFSGRFIADGMLLLKRKLTLSPDGNISVGKYQIVRRFEFMNLPVATRQGELFV